MLVDYHTHNQLCKHADGALEEYVQHAIQLGLNEIGLADHTPMPNDWDIEVRMYEEQFWTDYKPTVLALQEKYKNQITVKFAVEGDFFPGTEKWVEEFNGKNEFDYVIGSVHYLGEWGFDNPLYVGKFDHVDIDELYISYYDHIKRSAQSGLFDIVGHCDLVKKFGHRPKKNIEEILRATFEVVKESGMAVEINTSGLRKPVKEVYPSEQILKIVSEFGIPLTLGSDAHTPTDVGRDFDVARELVEKYGNGKISLFSKRVRSEVKI
ncbi:MAG: histidinol-phosphatase HisJ [Ignavibacteriales bacterium]|nr:histidinol-phosphatase HisJ [Ignavibacteriales bacterium]